MFGKISSWWAGSPPVETKPYNPADPTQNPLNPKGLKPYAHNKYNHDVCLTLSSVYRCCACPETKSARDDCFLREGAEADEKCKELVKKHVACMNALGFKI
ncbi:hypothetical protein HWV62_21046 [Athelia sp. TMB]|nr:hypothetical protein HWV62_21046 [Athelia sp. TMB]